MFARELPWDGLQPLDIKEKVASGERPRKASTMPSACEGLVRRMWHQTASIRPSFAQAIDSLKAIQESLPLARSSHREVSRRFADAADEFAALAAAQEDESESEEEGEEGRGLCGNQPVS